MRAALWVILCFKAELLKMIWKLRGTDRASHTKTDGVKDDFFSLQALSENLMLLSWDFQVVSRPCIFTTLNEIY